jgi:hypothetical protein
MPIEAAMRQPGRMHNCVHTHPVDAVLAKQPPRRIDDVLPRLGLLLIRSSHPQHSLYA